MPTEDNRIKIFHQLKIVLKKHEPPFVAKTDLDSRYELWSVKDLLIAGRKRKEVFFAGLIIQRNYVGFYYMPVYTHAAMKRLFKKELLATLKGKSCFHITRLDATLLTQIQEALKLGHRLYRKNGWI
jgi:hypothetical protein